MTETTVYLDSSALAKRYKNEAGSRAVDALYRRAETLDLRLAFSLWNIGEVLRTLGRARSQGLLSEREASSASWLFVRETMKFRALGALRIVPVASAIIGGALPLVLASRLSQPDALQIASCKEVGGVLVTSDAKMIEEARQEGITVLDPAAEADAKALEAL